MSIRKSLPASLLAWAVFLALGPVFSSLHSPAAPPDAPEAPVLALPTPVPEISDVHPGGATPLLDRAVERLSSTSWLEVVMRQQKNERGTAWRVEGTLRRGPAGCARLDMTVQMGPAARIDTRVISDGRALAQVVRRNPDPDRIVGIALPQEDAAREEILRRYGCGGPLEILRDVRTRASEWESPRRDGDTWILSARLTPSAADEALAAIGVGARAVRLRLDAASLLPRRVEWLNDANAAPIWTLEYSEWHLNEPFSADACARHFTYTPE